MSVALGKTMPILAKVSVWRKPGSDVFCVTVNEQICCPKCQMAMKFYDHRKRILKFPGGLRRWANCPRYKCQNPDCDQCGKLSIVLPDWVSPFKHYVAPVIRRCVEEDENQESLMDPENTFAIETYEELTGDKLSKEEIAGLNNDYPCDGTVKLWKKWIDGLTALISDSELMKQAVKILAFASLSILATIHFFNPFADYPTDHSLSWLEDASRKTYSAGYIIPNLSQITKYRKRC